MKHIGMRAAARDLHAKQLDHKLIDLLPGLRAATQDNWHTILSYTGTD
jgi:hypothetical protein